MSTQLLKSLFTFCAVFMLSACGGSSTDAGTSPVPEAAGSPAPAFLIKAEPATQGVWPGESLKPIMLSTLEGAEAAYEIAETNCPNVFLLDRHILTGKIDASAKEMTCSATLLRKRAG